MIIITDPELLRGRCLAARCAGKAVALTPTMGFFHDGHRSLMRWARDNCDLLVVSLFVNPTQFGPNEDLDAYPRDIARDADIAEAQGVDILFTPTTDALYSPAHATWVQVPELAKGLCAASRPDHFRGVATIVSKLLVLTLPHVTVFGEKDWQQLAIVKALVRDLGLPTRVEGRPIYRESDGLAMSSRNAYLSSEERAQAPQLHQGLLAAQRLVASCERDAGPLVAAVTAHYASSLPLGPVETVELVDPDVLTPIQRIQGPALLAAAVRVGRARLIDNLVLRP